MNKICQISTVLPPAKDGVGAAVMKIHSLLIKNGFDSIILTSTDQEKKTGILNKIVDWNLFEVYREIKELKKFGFSRIVFHYPSPRIKNKHSIIFLSFLLFINKISLIIYLHEYAFYSFKGKLKIFFLILFAGKIITTDELNLLRLKKLFLIKDRVFKLPTGSNFIIDNFECEIKFNEVLNICFWGYIMKGKGIRDYIFLADNFENEKVKFFFIGDTPENPTEEDQHLKNQILDSKKITYLGFLQDKNLIEELCKMHIIILPFEDGLSERRGSFMLAMQLGRIVITTIPKFEIEGLVNNLNVLFFNNPVELNQILNSLLKNPELLKTISINAKNWYNSYHSEENFMHNLYKLLF